MRNAIFVYEPSTVTISPEDALETTAKIYHYSPTATPTVAGEADSTSVPAAGTHQLPRGIHLVVSKGRMKVSGVQGEVVTMVTDKDEWPDPKPGIVALEPGATAASVKKFLTILKDISPDD